MFRLGLPVVLVALTLLPAWGDSAQGIDARAIIEKAVLAQGGLENLTRAEAGHRKVKGFFHTDNLPFTGESYSDVNNRVKIILRSGEADFPNVQIMVIEDNGKGWESYNGAVFEFNAKMQMRMRKGSYADKVSGLVTLLRDPGYTLTTIGETKIKGMPAVAVKVGRPGMPEISLFFDKGSRQLVKTAYRMEDYETGKEYVQEVYYSHFEDFDPAAEPMKALAATKRETGGPALLAFLKERIPEKDKLEKIELLVLELGRPSYSAREKAAAALRKLGPVAAGPLRLALKSDDREVARRAELLLDQLAKGDEPAQATAVIRLLAVNQPEGSVAALMEYLPFACEEAVAKEVLFALVSLCEKNDNARLAVEAYLKDENAQRKAAAVAVIGEDDGKFLKQPWRRVVVRGVRMARKAEVFRDGQPYFDLETFDHVFYNRFDDALFARP